LRRTERRANTQPRGSVEPLDLTDDEQRLVVVSRTQTGATRVRRVRAPEPIESAPSLSLSEAFLRGFLGGLPDNF
jgi:hypothetical protein